MAIYSIPTSFIVFICLLLLPFSKYVRQLVTKSISDSSTGIKLEQGTLLHEFRSIASYLDVKTKLKQC